jgi:hypothetical protein
MKTRPNQLVLIEWEDSYGCSSRWQDIDSAATPRALLCRSVGWIIARTKKCVVLVPHLADGETKQGCGDMTIPTACIVRTTPLQERGTKRA